MKEDLERFENEGGFVPETEEETHPIPADAFCPECSYMVLNTEGCKICTHCGWSLCEI
jgi:hypothetical protein